MKDFARQAMAALSPIELNKHVALLVLIVDVSEHV
jgi:hypothetical protein